MENFPGSLTGCLVSWVSFRNVPTHESAPCSWRNNKPERKNFIKKDHKTFQLNHAIFGPSTPAHRAFRGMVKIFQFKFRLRARYLKFSIILIFPQFSISASTKYWFQHNFIRNDKTRAKNKVKNKLELLRTGWLASYSVKSSLLLSPSPIIIISQSPSHPHHHHHSYVPIVIFLYATFLWLRKKFHFNSFHWIPSYSHEHLDCRHLERQPEAKSCDERKWQTFVLFVI